MWVRTTQLLFIAMMGSAISVLAAESAPSKSSPGTDERSNATRNLEIECRQIEVQNRHAAKESNAGV